MARARTAMVALSVRNFATSSIIRRSPSWKGLRCQICNEAKKEEASERRISISSPGLPLFRRTIRSIWTLSPLPMVPFYRLENWNFFRAPGWPYFFRSTMRESRVMNPLALRDARLVSSTETRAREIP